MSETNESVEMVCILCPRGCEMTLMQERNQPFEQPFDQPLDQPLVIGNLCKKGAAFALQEWKEPKRMLCSTVKTTSRRYPRLPVKTSAPIPRAKVLEIMVVLDEVLVQLPIFIGACLVENIGGLGVDLVATASMYEDEDEDCHGQ